MVMLATASKKVAPTPGQAVKSLSDRGWIFDLKWDGVRCVCTVDNGTVTLTNRNGRDTTWKYPDIVERFATLDGRWVFDGEIVAYDLDGNVSFQTVARRDQVETKSALRTAVVQTPAFYVAFDLLEIPGHDLRGVRQADRLTTLRRAAQLMDGEPFELSPSTYDGLTMWQFANDRDLEGLIAKRPDATYLDGRSDSWVKIKRVQQASFVVRTYTAGTGRFSETVGALLLELYIGGEFRHAGKVGTGFTDADRFDIQRQLDAGQTLVVDVEFAGLTDSGVPRFPAFRGVRTDIDPQDCTSAQFITTPKDT